MRPAVGCFNYIPARYTHLAPKLLQLRRQRTGCCYDDASTTSNRMRGSDCSRLNDWSSGLYLDNRPMLIDATAVDGAIPRRANWLSTVDPRVMLCFCVCSETFRRMALPVHCRSVFPSCSFRSDTLWATKRATFLPTITHAFIGRFVYFCTIENRNKYFKTTCNL